MKHQLYLNMLSWKRPADSKNEAAFIAKYIDSIPGIQRDSYGNRLLRLGNPSTMFSCHTDTMHREGGPQKIVVDAEVGLVFKDDNVEPLGADDTTGIYILKCMIEEGIPGLYIFHRCEEVGGLGSKWLRKNRPDLLEGIDRAIAFDRRGDDSVITHQGGTRCCSDVFAESLALLLGGNYKPDDTGLFTDTANYDDIVPECTNLSVGYENEHTPSEVQCLETLDKILGRALAIDWSTLPTVRDPAVVEDLYAWEATMEIDVYPTITDYDSAYQLVWNNAEKAAEMLFDAYGENSNSYQKHTSIYEKNSY